MRISFLTQLVSNTLLSLFITFFILRTYQILSQMRKQLKSYRCQMEGSTEILNLLSSQQSSMLCKTIRAIILSIPSLSITVSCMVHYLIFRDITRTLVFIDYILLYVWIYDLVLFLILLVFIILMGITVRELKPYDDLSMEYAHIKKIFILISYTLAQSITFEVYNYVIFKWYIYESPIVDWLDNTLLILIYLHSNLVFAYLIYKDLQTYCDIRRQVRTDRPLGCIDRLLLRVMPPSPLNDPWALVTEETGSMSEM